MQRIDIVSFLKCLRDDIVCAFEQLEKGEKFQRTPWEHTTGGGGEISLLRGNIFEKAAVNWSGVSGEEFPGSDGSGPFFATGISLITHMQNPHAPTVHMNLRYIETKDKNWFGGGYDLTPMGFPYGEDTLHFHNTAREALGEDLYLTFSKNAEKYFYIPHRKKERGVGGIFFDHYATSSFDDDFALWKHIGTTFLNAVLPIYERRIRQPFSEEEKEIQLSLRAHYVEFNLLYDRGTQFGFRSGGNPDAILCSLPPLVKW
jgi:coproporphyrinogen III oxidase